MQKSSLKVSSLVSESESAINAEQLAADTI
jgi:hypothetical protein